MIVNFDILPNESGIIYTNSNQFGEMHLRYFDLYSNENKVLFNDLKNPYSVQISKRSNTMIFHSNHCCYTYNLKSNEVNKIFNNENQSSACFGSMNDTGDLAAYVVSSNKPPYINVYNLKTFEEITITDEQSGNRFPYWSYSCQYLAYTHQKLNDINKRRWIQIFDINENIKFEIPKDENSDCIINANCWSKDEDGLVYLEIINNERTIKVYNVVNKKIDFILTRNNISEVSFYDTNSLLLITNNSLIKLDLITKVEMEIELNHEEKLHFRPCGSEIRIVNANIYFLTNQYNLYCWYKDEKDYKKILESEIEMKPIKEVITTKININQNSIPIYHYKPIKENGITLILAIGGPGEAVASDDRTLLLLLNEGYEVIVPAYRGCSQNPYKECEMGKQDVVDIVEVGNYYSKLYDYALPLVGYSYGGLLTLLALSNSKKVFSAGISLWGVTSLDKLPLKSKFYFSKDMNEYEKQQVLDSGNAVKNAKNIKTPLLIFHGSNDTTSVTKEVELIYKQLFENKITCDLNVYQDDGHGLKNNTRDYLRKIFNFINTQTLGKE